MKQPVASIFRKSALVLAVLIVAAFAFVNAFAGIARMANPDSVLKLAPADGPAKALLADRNLKSATPKTATAVIALARDALRAEALSTVALRSAGYAEALRGQAQLAGRLMSLAERVSRRDSATQLWMIEQKVKEGDLAGTLRHYDTLMRVTPATFDVLFPILTEALSEPQVRRAFTSYVRADPPWLAAFIQHAILQTRDIGALEEVVSRAGGLPKGSDYRSLESRLLSALVERKEYLRANDFYRRTLRGNGQTLVQTGFLPQNIRQDRAPIAWEAIENADLSANFANDANEGSVLIASAGSGTAGIALRKLLFLPTGRYAISVQSEWIEPGEQASADWAVDCLAIDHEFKSTSVGTPAGRSRWSFILEIHPGCAVQRITLNIAGGRGQAGSELLVRSVDLRRLPEQASEKPSGRTIAGP